MANSTQYVRSQMDIRKVGKNKTSVLDIVVRYDPGKFLRVGENPCVEPNGAPNWLAASRFVLQLMEQFKLQVDKEAKR